MSPRTDPQKIRIRHAAKLSKSYRRAKDQYIILDLDTLNCTGMAHPRHPLSQVLPKDACKSARPLQKGTCPLRNLKAPTSHLQSRTTKVAHPDPTPSMEEAISGEGRLVGRWIRYIAGHDTSATNADFAFAATTDRFVLWSNIFTLMSPRGSSTLPGS